MVKVIYYSDPTKEPVVSEHDKLVDFLLPKFKTRDELLDLRFFDTDLLCHEIDQSNGEFLDINEGVVAITHDSLIPRGADWIYYAIVFIAAAAAAVLLTPSLPPPAVGRDQSSGTNALGDSTNEPRVNQRIDDLFGTVNKHVPALWQVPYKIGIDDQEAEVLLCCVGRGKYDIDPSNWYDGDTPVKNIPNASVNIYEPYKNPNTDTPDIVIGEELTEELGIYRQSNDLNPAELLPANTLENAGANWFLSGTTTTATLYTDTENVNLSSIFEVGQSIKMQGFNNFIYNSNVKLSSTNGAVVGLVMPMYDPPIDLGEDGNLEYVVNSVTTDTLVLAIPASASTEVKDSWDSFTDYNVPTFAAKLLSDDVLVDGYVQDRIILDYGWETFDAGVYVAVTPKYYTQLLGESFDNLVGPVFTPAGATEAIFNFVSPNGFYKLKQNKEYGVYIQISIKIYEVDANGDDTGELTPMTFGYTSNGSSVTAPVFRTLRTPLPYDLCRIVVSRVTDRDNAEDVSNVDSVEWRDLYTFEPVNVTDFGDVTLAHILIPSNSQSRLIKQRKQNVDLTRKITQYLGDGNLGPAETYATDQFDQILIHMALDPFIGRMALENINADGFGDVRDEIINYFGSNNMTKFGYNFDTTNMTFQDTFITVADAVMCTPYVQSGVYDLFFEKKQTVSTMQVTCRNKINDTETRKINLDRQNDGVELTYRDNETGTSETIYLPDDQSARNPERREVNGCTTYEQAYKYAARMFNRQKYEIEFVTFDVDSFGRNIIPNKRIDSPDSTRFTIREGVTDGYRIYDGEVVEVNGLQVELSEPVSFVDGEDHYVTFTKKNGDNSEIISCTQVDEFTVLLSSLPTEPIYDGYDEDRTKFTLVSEQLQHSMAIIPKTIEFSLNDDNTEIHTINAVNYTDKVYQNDLDILE